MSRERQVLLAVLGVVLIGAAAGEHIYRRTVERRYHEAVQGRQQLELRFGEILATHEQLNSDLTSERRRSKELSEALASVRGQLEEAVGRLSQESRTVRELQMRLAAMQQHMDQLQGELALTLQEGQGGAKSEKPGPVQLERVLVSDAGAPGLQGRVVSVHRDWRFVVINLGWDAVKIGDTVSIFRNDELLAKARVERVQEGICAATLLPEWETAEVRINDLVRVL